MDSQITVALWLTGVAGIGCADERDRTKRLLGREIIGCERRRENESQSGAIEWYIIRSSKSFYSTI